MQRANEDRGERSCALAVKKSAGRRLKFRRFHMCHRIEVVAKVNFLSLVDSYQFVCQEGAAAPRSKLIPWYNTQYIVYVYYGTRKFRKPTPQEVYSGLTNAPAAALQIGINSSRREGGSPDAPRFSQLKQTRPSRPPHQGFFQGFFRGRPSRRLKF